MTVCRIKRFSAVDNVIPSPSYTFVASFFSSSSVRKDTIVIEITSEYIVPSCMYNVNFSLAVYTILMEVDKSPVSAYCQGVVH